MVSRTQPSGPLCLWQCFSNAQRSHFYICGVLNCPSSSSTLFTVMMIMQNFEQSLIFHNWIRSQLLQKVQQLSHHHKLPFSTNLKSTNNAHKSYPHQQDERIVSHVTQRRIASHVYACWTEWEAQVPSQRKAQVRATHFPGKDSVQLRLRSQDNPFCSPEESVSSSIWCVYSSTVIRGATKTD